MIVKVYRADNKVEVFSTENYVISETKDFHPIICSVEVFSDTGKKLISKKRKFPLFYKKVTFKTEKVQKLLQQIEEAAKNEPEKKA